MRSKTDFYRLFFEQLARRGLDVKRSQSSDYIADIYFKNQLVTYFSKADTVIQNPFVTVKDKLIRLINDTAQDTANKAGICRRNDGPPDFLQQGICRTGFRQTERFGG